MKIGMMSLWNAANGPSLHAELVGRAWAKSGHDLKVFSSEKHPDARPTLQPDEDYVIRHFRVDEVAPVTRAVSFDPSPIFNSDYQVFVAQNVVRLPAEKLLEHFPRIKAKAVTVMVAHEGMLPDDPLFYQFDWDAVVCFDHRFKEFLQEAFPPEKIHVIPYPCHPLELGDKKKARQGLVLPLDQKVVFSFGFRLKRMIEVLPAMQEMAQKFYLRHIIITNPQSDVNELRNMGKKYDFVDFHIYPLTMSQVYTYLHASDAALFHRASDPRYKAVVSSVACQVLGSGCPALFFDSNYVELNGDEVIKYRDQGEMKEKLTTVLQQKAPELRPVKKFLKDNNSDKIGEQYIKLFQKLLQARNR
jgi:hypothetical protein